ncbi:MAG: MipA/OmpV family protein [Rhodospirillales bacterium]|nr:MipA/OmpV family protein [Rhodospirillales bacterium]
MTDNVMVVGTGGLMYLSDAYTDSSIIDDDYQLSVILGLLTPFRF